MSRTFNENIISIRATERKLQTGDKLWIAGEKLSVDLFKKGNSQNNPGVYLRWRDLEIPGVGKIEGDDQKKVVIRLGQGISMFIEKMVHSDFNLIDSSSTALGKGALQKLAAEKGYQDAQQIFWFKMADGKVLPSGLEVVFDNEPPGHCVLTVVREMTVEAFLLLVIEHVQFEFVGTDIFNEKGK